MHCESDTKSLDAMLCPQLSVTNLENPHLTIVTQSHSELDIDEQIKNSEIKIKKYKFTLDLNEQFSYHVINFSSTFVATLLKARTLLRYADSRGDIAKEIKIEIK